MSKRTADATKAIKLAWENERDLVLEGKGTRDWTPEQQRSIIDKGKAYDDDGKAFEGHHMKSAEAYPENQGEPGNIQFLSRTEHRDAHGGDFRNPTNGYYDPVIRLTVDFGDDRYKPCKVIELSDPIEGLNNKVHKAKSVYEFAKSEENSINNDEDKTNNESMGNASKATLPVFETREEGNRLIKLRRKVANFCGKHKKEIGVGVWAGVGVMVTVEKIKDVCDTIRYNNENNETAEDDGDEGNSSSVSDLSSQPEVDDYFESTMDTREYPEERLSPKEHMVKQHGQHYHTKEGIKWIQKDPFPRGRRNEDSEE